MYTGIEDEFFDAVSISLMSGIWTTKQMMDFMGAAFNIKDSKFQKKTIVIGMMLMPGKHNAENIASVLMSLVNRYKSLDILFIVSIFVNIFFKLNK